MHHFIKVTEHYLASIGVFGYVVIFIIALLESTPFIGTLVPGATLIGFAGFLASQGYFSFSLLVLFCSIGALTGDLLGFFLGKNGSHYFKNENKFLKLEHLNKGEAFFNKHGKKSIFIARFIGPIRAIVPFIAGLSKMKFREFMSWNALSAICWAYVYLGVGYFFGKTFGKIEIWITRTTSLILISALISGLIIFYYRFIRIQHIKKANFLIALISVLIFLTMSACVFLGTSTNKLDFSIVENVSHIRSTYGISLMMAITNLGDKIFIIGATIILSIALFLRKRKQFSIILLGSIATSAVLSLILKFIFHRARPPFGVYPESLNSFPSGHSSLAMAFYGFIIFLILREQKSATAQITYTTIFILLIILIGVSRVYLGVHYPTDVLAGFIVGFVSLIVGIELQKHLKVV